MLYRLAAAVLLLSVAACAGPHFPPVTLEGTQVRTMTAADGGAYRIMVAVPPGQAPAEGWPVVYVLDGAIAFATFADSQRVQSGRAEATGVVPAVVVGIADAVPGGTDLARRQRDLTPDGADAFHGFLENVVKPALERDLPIDRRRQTLFGHSYGGLFALHVLLTRPDAFQTYVAASPSLWWHDRALLARAARTAFPASGPKVLISVGEREQFAPGVDAATTAKLAKRRQVDNAAEMARYLLAAGLRVEFVRFADENHGSVLPAAISRAVRFMSN